MLIVNVRQLQIVLLKSWAASAAPLVCLLLSMILMAQPVFAGCKESKPKNWEAGSPITLATPAPNTAPIVVCVGQSVIVSGSATDRDHWAIRCKADNSLVSDGYSNDSLTYRWSGTGTFTSATSASTSWTAPATAGSVTLTCTIDDTPTALGAGETGSRGDAPLPKPVTVCVVDPGTKPTSVTAVEYREIPGLPPVAGPQKAWGNTIKTPGIVSIEAYFDCNTKKWKCVVTSAKSIIGVWISEDRTEPSNDLVTDRALACDLIYRLARGEAVADPNWPRSATVAHEASHVAAWKTALNDAFGTLQTTVEGMSLPYTCGQTASDAKDLFLATKIYKDAVNKMDADADSAFAPNATHANGKAEAAGQAAADARITEIRALVAEKGWTACP